MDKDIVVWIERRLARDNERLRELRTVRGLPPPDCLASLPRYLWRK